MESVKMIITLFLFCFIAALLLAFVDKSTFDIRTKLQEEKEALAKKEVLFMKDGGVNLSNFPKGQYSSKIDSKNKAEFSFQNGEISFSNLTINGKDYVKENKEFLANRKNNKISYSPAFIVIRTFNERKLIKSDGIIEGGIEDIKAGKLFLKKNKFFVDKLIKLLLNPIKYVDNKMISFVVNGKKSLYKIADNKFSIEKSVIKVKITDGIAEVLTVNGKKVKPGMKIKISEKTEILINNLNEYPVKIYSDAFFGENKIGTVYKISPICFADKIQTVIGLNNKKMVSGIKVLSQAETPGLGARILEVKKGQNEPWWQSCFHGLKIDDIYLKIKDERKGKVDVITAATITPRKLTRAIRESVKEYFDYQKSASGGNK